MNELIENVYFSIELNSGNAALVDDPQGEVCRILEDIRTKIRQGRTDGPIGDMNGNKVGTWLLDIEKSEGSDDE